MYLTTGYHLPLSGKVERHAFNNICVYFSAQNRYPLRLVCSDKERCLSSLYTHKPSKKQVASPQRRNLTPSPPLSSTSRPCFRVVGLLDRLTAKTQFQVHLRAQMVQQRSGNPTSSLPSIPTAWFKRKYLGFATFAQCLIDVTCPALIKTSVLLNFDSEKGFLTKKSSK